MMIAFEVLTENDMSQNPDAAQTPGKSTYRRHTSHHVSKICIIIRDSGKFSSPNNSKAVRDYNVIGLVYLDNGEYKDSICASLGESKYALV